MAQLKDSIVSGNLRVTDEVLTDTIQADKIKAPTTSGGTTYGVGSNGQVLKSNGTSTYWGNDNNSGDVTGPSSATVNDIATFNNTNGKVIKDSLPKKETDYYNDELNIIKRTIDILLNKGYKKEDIFNDINEFMNAKTYQKK